VVDFKRVCGISRKSIQAQNFVGALSSINQLLTEKWEHELKTTLFSNPPKAINTGDVWERQIRSVTAILKDISCKYGGTFSTNTLLVVFYEIMAFTQVSAENLPFTPN